MKKKQIKVASILFFAVLASFFYFRILNKESQPPTVQKEEKTNENKEILPEIEVKPLSQEVKEENTITLFVSGKNYIVPFKEGDTLYDAMEKLQSNKENNFSFGFKEYPSLGIFINEINGVKEAPNQYWIYYVNNKEASVGVSKYFPKDGDVINWKQE